MGSQHLIGARRGSTRLSGERKEGEEIIDKSLFWSGGKLLVVDILCWAGSKTQMLGFAVGRVEM